MDHCVFTCITNNNNGAAICLKTSGGGTIEDCQFIDCASVSGSGGGIATDNDAVTATIRRCTFTRCRAVNGGALFRIGKCVEDCVFEDCTIGSNTGGGAISQCAANAALTNCVFRNCSSPSKPGGAVYLKKPAEFVECVFTNCSAVGSNCGGAVYTESAATVTMISCNFEDCSGTGLGAAIFSNAGGSCYTNCTFVGNSTYNGGAINCQVASKPYGFYNCTFTSNISYNAGPAIFCNNAPSTIDVRNCLFTGNVTQKSSGSMCIHSKATTANIDNCTFTGNRATASDAKTAPVFVASGTSNVRNCIFWDNVDSGANVRNAYKSSGTLNVSTTACDGTPPTGEGLIALASSPFVDAASGDYKLAKKVNDLPNSCIDVGTTLAWMAEGSLDLAAAARVFGNAPDLGAYEYSNPAANRGLMIIMF